VLECPFSMDELKTFNSLAFGEEHKMEKYEVVCMKTQARVFEKILN
jgi:hypothetical protein